jgi:hypothetical protein
VKPGNRPGSDNPFVTEESLKAPIAAARVWVADINGDGKPDLLVGDGVQLISPAEGLTKEELMKRLGEWTKKFESTEKDVGESHGRQGARKGQQTPRRALSGTLEDPEGRDDGLRLAVLAEGRRPEGTTRDALGGYRAGASCSFPEATAV